jgi:hypothetical protein
MILVTTLVMLKVPHTHLLCRIVRPPKLVETCSRSEESREKHPYMFFMGTDFRKLKAPLFWYDILHVLDVLSHFAWAWKDKRFRQMLKTVKSKANTDGQFVPESVWTAWKDWDFSQKKIPSKGLTLFIARIMKRVSAN